MSTTLSTKAPRRNTQVFAWVLCFFLLLSVLYLFTGNPLSANASITEDNSVNSLQATGVLSITVTGAQSGLPIPFARTLLYDSSSPFSINSGFANSQGQITFKNLATKEYFVSVNRPTNQNYAPQFYQGKSSLTDATPINVSDGQTTSISVALEVGGVITGRLTEADTGKGRGSSHSVSVSTKDICGNPNRYNSSSVDSTGFYTLTGLETGIYFLEVRNSFGIDDPYLGEWYDDKQEFSQATALNVTQGMTTTNVNLALTRGATITGVVTAADTGLPLADHSVVAYAKSGTSFDFLDLVRTNKNGVYQLTALLGTTFYLHVTSFSSDSLYVSEMLGDKFTLDASIPVDVSAGGTKTDVNFVLERGGTITGKVTAETNNAGLGDVDVRACRPEQEFCDSATTDASGMYTITGVASGAYSIEFNTRNGDSEIYAEEFYDNKPVAMQPTSVTVTALVVTPNINAALAIGGVISGTVTYTDGTPARDAVIFVTDSTATRSWQERADGEGRYKVVGLPAGFYTFGFSSSSLDPKPSAPNVCMEDTFPLFYYDQKGDGGQATLVNMALGQTVSNINAVYGGAVTVPSTPTATPVGTPAATPTATPVGTPAAQQVYLPVVNR